MTGDQSNATTQAAIQKMRATGAKVLAIGNGGLNYVKSSHPLMDPISMTQTSYGFIEATAQALGRNPDQPRLLKKITETV